MLSISSFKERSSYWKELLQLFWLRQLGCKTAFCVVSQVSKDSPKTRRFVGHLDLSAVSIDSHYIYEILSITREEMENYYKHFRTFLHSLNKKQYQKFLSDNMWFHSIIIKAY